MTVPGNRDVEEIAFADAELAFEVVGHLLKEIDLGAQGGEVGEMGFPFTPKQGEARRLALQVGGARRSSSGAG